MKRTNKGPTGTEALGAIGVGLGQLFDGLKEVIEQAESSASGSHHVHRSGGENGRPEVMTSFTSGSVKDFVKARGKDHDKAEDVAANAQYSPDYGSAEAGIAAPDPTEFDAASSWELIEEDDYFLFVCDLSGKSRHDFQVLIEEGQLIGRFGGNLYPDITADLPEAATSEQPFYRVRNGIAEVRLDRTGKAPTNETKGTKA